MAQKIDLIGKRYGRWLVLSAASNCPHGYTRWNCICDCGTERVVRGSMLRQNTSKSCGCYARDMKIQRMAEATRKHGMANTMFYRKWKWLKAKCNSLTNKNMVVYIEEWEDFIEFKKDMYASYLEAVEKYGEANIKLARKHEMDDFTRENTIWAYKYASKNNKPEEVMA